jgi:hypothetical protein
MNILACPFSGSSFIHQVGFVYNLANLDYKPDLMLGTSGGNVTNYIAAAADWEPNSILRLFKLVNSSLFIKKWPTIFHAYFKGSMYDRPSYMDDFFDTIFNKESISKYELWTGTYNISSNRSQLFCNKEESKALFSNKIDTKKIGCEVPIYLNGDIKRISLISEASAAIPTVVPPVEIDKQLYVDGGVSSASPLTIMSDELIKISKNFHITYVSGFDVEENGEEIDKLYSSIISVVKFSVSGLSNSVYYRDRSRGIDLLKETENKEVYHKAGPCDPEMMKTIERLKKDANCSFIEYYPDTDENVDLLNFDLRNSTPLLNKSKAKFKFRAWWTGEKNIFSSLFD